MSMFKNAPLEGERLSLSLFEESILLFCLQSWVSSIEVLSFLFHLVGSYTAYCCAKNQAERGFGVFLKYP